MSGGRVLEGEATIGRQPDMFYSQWLLSKKGPLGTLWIAAHSHKRLKKEQVKEISLSSSVDKILQDDISFVAYRILGFLLLGIVKIFSKKVDYLFHDCHDVLSQMRDFVGIQKANMHVKVISEPSFSITLPERFELDTFNLEIAEDVIRNNVSDPADITLQDAWKTEGHGCHVFGQYGEGDDMDFESCMMICAPELSPHHFMDDRVSLSDNLSIMDTSMERLRANCFSLEECLDPLIFGDVEEDEKDVGPFAEEDQPNGDKKFFDSEMNMAEQEECPSFVRSCDEEQNQITPLITFPENMCLESTESQITREDHSVSTTVDVTPESKFPNTSVTITPEFLAVHTPAIKERAKVSVKRKLLVDDIVVLPNKVLKQWIDNASDLTCKRRKAPHSAHHAWKAEKMLNLPQNFLKPLIPCMQFDFRSFLCKNKSITLDPVEPVQNPVHSDGSGAPPFHRSSDEIEIAPSTPVNHSTSLRLHVDQRIVKETGVAPASSFGSLEKVLSPSEDQEIEASCMNELLSLHEEESEENGKWSVRTEIAARYLQCYFLELKKQKEEEVVNLSHVLKGKTKKESARFIFEILVLKSGGFVNVKQENGYDDVFVFRSPTFMLPFKADVLHDIYD